MFSNSIMSEQCFKVCVLIMQEIYYRLESALGVESVPGLASGASDIFSAAALLAQGEDICILTPDRLEHAGAKGTADHAEGAWWPI